MNSVDGGRPAQLELGEAIKLGRLGEQKYYSTQPVSNPVVKGDVVVKKNYPYKYRYAR
jgi:hypothetical protein